MKKVFEIAKNENITTAIAADRLAESRIEEMMRVRSSYIQTEKSSISKR